MSKQQSSERVGTPGPRGTMGGVTTASQKGQGLSGSANNKVARQGKKIYGSQGGTRPITPGTPGARHNSFGTVTRSVKGFKAG